MNRFSLLPEFSFISLSLLIIRLSFPEAFYLLLSVRVEISLLPPSMRIFLSFHFLIVLYYFISDAARRLFCTTNCFSFTGGWPSEFIFIVTFLGLPKSLSELAATFLLLRYTIFLQSIFIILFPCFHNNSILSKFILYKGVYLYGLFTLICCQEPTPKNEKLYTLFLTAQMNLFNIMTFNILFPSLNN